MKIKKNNLYIGIGIIVVVTLLVFYLKPFKKSQEPENNAANQSEWKVDKDGYLSYPLERSEVLFNRQDYAQDGNLTIHKITYRSTNADIYGFLVLPSSAKELLPGVVLLPGAGVSKESELGLAKKIASLDIAVLTIDQRGVGETKSAVTNLDQDFASFSIGQEPYQHLMVYDALRAYDLMKNVPFIDSSRIIIAGESLGGRIAIIATAIDRNVKGALVISSAGFDFKEKGDAQKDRFLKSIDSDHYISLISPRKLVMMHNANDKIIPVSFAAASFVKAQEPKEFVLVNDTSCNHGYCDSMYNGLVESLDYLLDIKSKTLVSVPDK